MVITKITYKRKPKAPCISLDQPGRLRVSNLMALFNVSHQTVYKRIDDGGIPKPDGYDLMHLTSGRPGRPYWFTETIRPLVTPPGLPASHVKKDAP